MAYAIKHISSCRQLVWQILDAFNNQKWDDGIELIDKKLDKDEKTIEIWNICFDFCRLSKRKNMLDTITARYANIFNIPPPDWISHEVSSIHATTSEGIVLNIISVSTPESEQYTAIHKTILDKKTAILIKFTPGKPLSWQETGVQRLAAILNDIQKLKIPVFGEHIELPLLHIKKMSADTRSVQDWDVLFFCLRLLGKEAEFEEEALNYAMLKGMSPPSYVPFPKIDKHQWFKTTPSINDEDDITNPIIILNGSLASSMTSLQQRIVVRLQSKPAVILDLRGLTHIDFTSAISLIKLHDKVWTNNTRKLFAVEPSAIIKRLLIISGWPEASFQTMAPTKL